MAGDQTFIVPADVRRTGNLIAGLLPDTAMFQNAASIQVKAGNFDAAKMIEAAVQGCQAGLLQHVTDLKQTFEFMGTNLVSVSDALEGKDIENANDIDNVEATSPTFNDYVPTL